MKKVMAGRLMPAVIIYIVNINFLDLLTFILQVYIGFTVYCLILDLLSDSFMVKLVLSQGIKVFT